jgi:molybdate transport system substrate-binding protein
MKRYPAIVAIVLVLTSCSADGTEGSPRCAQRQTLTVLAAASLTEAFGSIGRSFDPCVDVRFSFGASDELAQQIQAGSPADVFASASAAWMDAVAKDPGVEDAVAFARNRLVVITPPDDPAHIGSIADLARPGVKLVLAATGVPAGDYARQIFENAGIAKPALANVVSNEEDVKGVVQKVVLGEADAGVVYVTDVTPDVRPQVRKIRIPDDVNVVATYPIAVVATTTDRPLAARFVRYVSGPSARATLASFGFLPPS